jgi:CRP-like cAMP-binding protein
MVGSTPISHTGKRQAFVRKKAKASFDPKMFLAKVGKGKTISKYRKDQIVFSQGQAADAVFYIQQGKVKLTVVSEQGKEAVVATYRGAGGSPLGLANKRAGFIGSSPPAEPTQP